MDGTEGRAKVGEPDEAMKREMAEIDGAMKKMSIQDIVKQDPKFIERAINGLDKMMSQLAQRRANAEKQIADDRRAIEGLDKEISMFEGKLADVTAHLEGKRQERESLGREYEESSKAITSTVRDAEALFSKARMLNRRMARKAASDHLTTTRGFTTGVTTRDYITAPPKNIGRTGLQETQRSIGSAQGTGKQPLSKASSRVAGS